MWELLPDAATPFMLAAIRVFRASVLAAGNDGAVPSARQDAGRQLLRLVFGTQDAGQRFPPVLAEVLAEPDSEAAATALTDEVCQALDADPAMTSAAAALVADFYRRQADGGSVRALVDLGDFLHNDEPEAACDAYREAAAAGQSRALIGLAGVLRNVLGDEDAALEAYEQALGSGDADVAAEAMYEMAMTREPGGDEAAARAMFERAIGTGHPEWAAAAMVGLANMQARLGEPGAAEALYREAVSTGKPHWSGRASLKLGELLEESGDADGARAAWRHAIESRNSEWAGPAFTSLVNLLRELGDAAGLRAAYEQAAALRNPDALYALDALGSELNSRGDTEGAHAAWRQAIDAGYEQADWLRDRMAPPGPEPGREVYPAGLPPEFDPRNMVRTGLDVLEHGLPALPETLAYQMAIPVAYWKAGECAVVLTLRYSRHGGEPAPVAVRIIYARGADGWIPPRWVSGSRFSHDPIASPGSRRHLGGQPMVCGGGSIASEVTAGRPAAVVTGHAAPEVRHLALIAGGREDRRPLESRFGAWVVCTERPGPFQLAGIDENGNVLATLDLPLRPATWKGHDHFMKRRLPPRGAVLRDLPMIASFDVDCGELVPGHHFVARGLAGPCRVPIPDEWDGDSAEYELMLRFEEAGGYPAFSLEYELVPGVSAAEGGNVFRYLVGVSYAADVRLPWEPSDGGAIAPFEGGETTHGSRGDWPLPQDAAVLTFSVSAVGPDGFPDYEHPAGDLVVDLVRGEAAWQPAGAIDQE